MRCNCDYTKSVRKGSFFAHGCLSMKDQMKIMSCFVSDVTVSATARLLNISRPTVTQYYDNLCGEIYDYFQENPISFTEGDEFEVDECLLKHVWFSKNRRHKIQWIGGILERESGKVLLYRIDDRSAASLIPPILENVPPGVWVYSDELTSYHRLYNHPYVHFTVNHSKLEYARIENFCDREVNVHINTLEGVNREIRRRFSNKSCRKIERIDLTLSEIMYRRSGVDLYYPFKY